MEFVEEKLQKAKLRDRSNLANRDTGRGGYHMGEETELALGDRFSLSDAQAHPHRAWSFCMLHPLC